MTLQSPLARVRGLGSAKHGTGHFWEQRVTAVVLAPLAVWAAIALLRLDLHDYEAVVAWLRAPLNTVLMLLLVIGACHHGQLGVQVVIEDYVHDEWQKIAALILVKLLAAVAGLASVLAILRVFVN